MKRVFSVGLIFIILISCCSNAQAESGIAVSANDVEIKNNRLFDIKISVDTDVDIAAATFEIIYDSSIMEYRGVSSDVADGMIKAKDNNGKVTAIFLKDEGVENGKDTGLFSVKFKSINSGSCNAKISVSECVDNCGKEHNYNACTQCEIKVQGSTSAIELNDSAVTDKSGESKGKSAESRENKSHRTGEEYESKSDNVFSVMSGESDNRDFYLLIIMVLILVIIIGSALLVRRMNNIEKKLNEAKEEKTEERN